MNGGREASEFPVARLLPRDPDRVDAGERGEASTGRWQCDTQPPIMKPYVANFTGWLASVLFVAVATMVWAITSLVVFLSGNRTLHGRN